MSDAITLDALGTLIALEPPAPHLAVALDVSLADAERAIAKEIAYYRAHFDQGRDERSLEALRRRCALIVGDELGRDVPVEVLLGAIRFTPFDDVVPALSDLRAAGTRLVVVSNWDISLHAVLERLGLAPLLDAIITSAEAGARKPSPEIFRLAGPARLHVGDSLEEDVAGARAAGIEPVLIRRDGGTVQPGVRTISSLAEL